jgi:hypothetical protein
MVLLLIPTQCNKEQPCGTCRSRATKCQYEDRPDRSGLENIERLQQELVAKTKEAKYLKQQNSELSRQLVETGLQICRTQSSIVRGSNDLRHEQRQISTLRPTAANLRGQKRQHYLHVSKENTRKRQLTPESWLDTQMARPDLNSVELNVVQPEVADHQTPQQQQVDSPLSFGSTIPDSAQILDVPSFQPNTPSAVVVDNVSRQIQASPPSGPKSGEQTSFTAVNTLSLGPSVGHVRSTGFNENAPSRNSDISLNTASFSASNILAPRCYLPLQWPFSPDTSGVYHNTDLQIHMPLAGGLNWQPWEYAS